MLIKVLIYFCFLAEEERAGCFTVIVCLMSCDCQCSVALPRAAVGLSAVCDCGISWSHSLFVVSVNESDKLQVCTLNAHAMQLLLCKCT